MYDLYVNERMVQDRLNEMFHEAKQRRLVRQAYEARRAAGSHNVWERAWNSVVETFSPLVGRTERTAPGAC